MYSVKRNAEVTNVWFTISGFRANVICFSFIAIHLS